MSDYFPREFINLLLEKIDIVDLIDSHVPLKQKSKQNYFARCPFHQEKSASFSVSQPKQFYYCFGCGAHGNAIDFLMQFERLSFPETIENLSARAGLPLPAATKPSTKKSTIQPEIYNVLAQAAHFYYQQMRTTPCAIAYLKQRGITGNIAKQFQIGYAPNDWHSLVNKFDLAAHSLLQAAGLIIKKENGRLYDRFRDRIMFPIRDLRGRVIGFGGRILAQGEPKYLNSPESECFQKGQELYGLYEALTINRQLDRILVVEGYMDVIALFQQGITYSVATMGTTTTTQHLQRLFRYSSEIIFCFDGDQAGRNAAWRAALQIFPILHDSLQIRFLFLPEGQDPDSLIRQESQTTFLARLKSAISLSEFFFNALKEQADLVTLEGRAHYATLALQQLKTLKHSLLQSMMVEELSKRTRVDLQALKQQLQASMPQIHSTATPYILENKTKLLPPLKLILALIVQQPNLALTLNGPLPNLQIRGYDFLLQLIAIVQKSPNITTGGLIEHWRGQKEDKLLAKLAQWPHMVPDANCKTALNDAWRQLLMFTFDQEINNLLTKAAAAELTAAEKHELAQWIAKKKCLITT